MVNGRGSEPTGQHERLRLEAFVAQLRAEGRAVGDPQWSDGPDAWVQLDGERTALELGCAYASPAKPLWRGLAAASSGANFSSSGDDRLAAERTVAAARLPRLIADLRARLTKKCEARYGRSYLVLDGSHDQLDAQIPVENLIAGLVVPSGCGFTAIYLVEPRFETPRRFVLLFGDR